MTHRNTIPFLILFFHLLGSLEFANSSSSPSSYLPMGEEGEAIQCRDQIITQLKDWKIKTNSWRYLPVVWPGVTGFQTPTENFGTWVEYNRAPSSKVVRLKRVSDDRWEQIGWDQSTCQVVRDHIDIIPTQGSQSFTSKDLEQLLKTKNARGLIYVWTPRMVNAPKFYRTFEKVSQDLGLRFIPVMAADVDLDQAKSVAALYNFPLVNQKLHSTELDRLGVNSHYPTSVIYANGQLSANIFRGVADKDRLKKEIQIRLANITAKGGSQ